MPVECTAGDSNCVDVPCRLVRALALNSGRCKQALQDTATPLLFLQALRVLNTPAVRASLRGSSDGHLRPSADGDAASERHLEPRVRARHIHSGACYAGVDLRSMRYAAVGAAAIVACRHVKSRSASRTFKNYGRLCRAPFPAISRHSAA